MTYPASDVPARLDRLPWSAWHWRVVIALGVAWVLDGLEVTLIGSIGSVLARPDTATDADYEHIEGVIAHEYFHNWTGNRITCRDWFQLSLKEGFTVFRDQEFTGDRTSKAVKRIEDVNMLRTRQFAEDAGPMAHPIRPDAYIEINNFYTLTVYEKGAEVVRMIHTLLGAEGFRKGSDLYFERHDGQAVTCEDFVNAMEAANSVDLSQFRRWYAQAGTPVLMVQEAYDPSAQTLTLTLSQHCPPTPGQAVKEPLHIPVTVGLINRDGSEATDQVILQLTQAEQSFVFEHLKERPVTSILRGFSAPVKLVMARSLEELAFLLSHDSDTFNRWEAGQQLAGQIIAGLIADVQNGKALQLNPILIDAFLSRSYCILFFCYPLCRRAYCVRACYVYIVNYIPAAKLYQAFTGPHVWVNVLFYLTYLTRSVYNFLF